MDICPRNNATVDFFHTVATMDVFPWSFVFCAVHRDQLHPWGANDRIDVWMTPNLRVMELLKMVFVKKAQKQRKKGTG